MKRVWLLAAAMLACHGHASSPDRVNTPPGSSGSDAEWSERAVADAAIQLPTPIDKIPAPPWTAPPNTVALDRTNAIVLRMDRTEVTVKAYRECVDAGVCTAPESGEREPDVQRRKDDDQRGVFHVCPKQQMTWYESGHDDYPINCVTFSQAWRYCRFRHGRLPTGYEWESFARGTFNPSTRRFPWGDRPRPSCRVAVMANRKGPGCGTGGPMPVGSKPKGASPDGALDMVGNLNEIIVSDERPSQGLFDDTDFTADGGSYAGGSDSRIFEPLGGGQAGPTSPTVGFRCIYYPPGRGSP